jgi:hypothetical protein
MIRDSRLIGTWRSDARKTALDSAVRRDISAIKKKKLLAMFGKLELRYTPTHCYSSFEGTTTANRYRVVAKDPSSVALVVSNPILGDHIVHIHFERSHYWIFLGSGRMREFFKRVLPRQERTRTKAR